MADRTWNAIERRINDEQWTEVAIAVAKELLIDCPNAHGVFDLPLGRIKRYFRGLVKRMCPSVRDSLVEAAVDDAIQELVQAGFIRLYRDGQIVWIRSKFKRSKWWKNAKNQLGALNMIQERYPEALEDFMDFYGLRTMDVRSNVRSTYDQRTMDVRGTTDSESDSESEEKKPEKQHRGKWQESLINDAINEERLILDELKTIQRLDGWEYDETKHLRMIRALANDYPKLDLLQVVRDFRFWIIENPGKTKKHAQRLRMFCEKAKDVPSRQREQPEEPDRPRGALEGGGGYRLPEGYEAEPDSPVAPAGAAEVEEKHTDRGMGTPQSGRAISERPEGEGGNAA